jgi:hypothetical protein
MDLTPSRRTILSIIRTAAYACLVVVLALWHGEVKGTADAVLAGALYGDYLTWLIWSVIELPENLLHGCYDVCVYTFFALLVSRMRKIDLSADMNGEFLAIMFLAFLLVIGIKILYLTVVFAEKELLDDDD